MIQTNADQLTNYKVCPITTVKASSSSSSFYSIPIMSNNATIYEVTNNYFMYFVDVTSSTTSSDMPTDVYHWIYGDDSDRFVWTIAQSFKV